MRIGGRELPDGWWMPVAFAGLVAVLLLWTWYQNGQATRALKEMCAEQGWRWAGSAPAELKDALRALQVDGGGWSASKVMVAQDAAGADLYLFHYQRRNRPGGGASSSSTTDGVACLAPGGASATAPVFTVDRRPSGAVGAIVGLSGDVVEDVGSEAFRTLFLVQLRGAAVDTVDEAELGPIEIAPELEAELTRWHRPLGTPMGWSSVWMRGEHVLVTGHWRQRVPPRDWERLLEMAEGVRGARRTE